MRFFLLNTSAGRALLPRRLLGAGAGAGTSAPITGYQKVNEILNTVFPGEIGYGWKYYDDGTSIGPDGAYYFQGKKVWSPS